MKKLLLYFSFFIFHLSLCSAQDTIVLNSGEKLGVKIFALADEIVYTKPPGDEKFGIHYSLVNYIKYSDGSIYSINRTHQLNSAKKDSLRKKESMFRPYVAVSDGISNPLPFGYGNNSYENQDPDTGNWNYNDAGCAQNGSVYSITAGLVIYRGWEITGIYNSIKNGIDAYDYMNKVATAELGTSGISSSLPTLLPITNVTTNETYFYTNHSILFGISKSIEGKYLRFGFSLMAGEFVANFPAMQGVATYQTYTQYTNNVSTNYYFNLNSQKQENPAYLFSVNLDIKIKNHFFIRCLAEIENSNYITFGTYQLVNMTNGSIFTSGFYAGSNLDITLFNATLGLGYKF